MSISDMVTKQIPAYQKTDGKTTVKKMLVYKTSR
jgi:hypothetical protein